MHFVIAFKEEILFFNKAGFVLKTQQVYDKLCCTLMWVCLKYKCTSAAHKICRRLWDWLLIQWVYCFFHYELILIIWLDITLYLLKALAFALLNLLFCYFKFWIGKVKVVLFFWVLLRVLHKHNYVRKEKNTLSLP